MADLRQAALQALEALEKTHTQPGCEQWQAERKASVALRAALAQPEQEPVAWRYQNANTDHVYLVWNKGTGGRNWTPLYTTPPRREWQGLTEGEITDCWTVNDPVLPLVGTITRAIEAALKEKNA